jgi:hypothetical protein
VERLRRDNAILLKERDMLAKQLQVLLSAAVLVVLSSCISLQEALDDEDEKSAVAIADFNGDKTAQQLTFKKVPFFVVG